MEAVNSPDVTIVGAGLIGVSIAMELRDRGLQVLVLDRGQPGREASSAAAGMLAASDPETPPALRLLVEESAQLFPDYVRRIEGLSGISADFRRQGAIDIAGHSPAPKAYRKLLSEDLAQLEPGLQPGELPAFFVVEDSVDPALLMQSALVAAERSGIEVRGQTEVLGIRAQRDGGEVVTPFGRFVAGAVVDCRGAWSGVPVRPRKGQALYLQPLSGKGLEHVLRAPGVYLVPRSSGRIFAGATVEDVGFDKTVEPATIAGMHATAVRWLPQLAEASVIESWAGLRPGTPDNLPILGQAEAGQLFIATGHFRNGILLAPVTAHIMADLITGEPAPYDIAGFSPLRFAGAKA